MLAPGSRVELRSARSRYVEKPRASAFQLNLDGQQVTNKVALGFGQPRYSRDAIGEFEFVSNRFDAAQGRSSGVQVNAVTKSGTNTPAGTFSGYFRNDKFNAADPVAGQVLPYSNQQLSATFGGPIQRDRFHYFGSYEYEREPQTYIYNTPYPKFNGSADGHAQGERRASARLDYQFSPQNAAVGARLPLSTTGFRTTRATPAGQTGRWRRPSARTGAASRCWRRSRRCSGTRASNEIKGGHCLFHWNQFAHVKNANSLPGRRRASARRSSPARVHARADARDHAAGHRRGLLHGSRRLRRCRSIAVAATT